MLESNTYLNVFQSKKANRSTQVCTSYSCLKREEEENKIANMDTPTESSRYCFFSFWQIGLDVALIPEGLLLLCFSWFSKSHAR